MRMRIGVGIGRAQSRDILIPYGLGEFLAKGRHFLDELLRLRRIGLARRMSQRRRREER